MKKRHLYILFFSAITLICLSWPVQVLADSATLAFESQTLDLDTGMITEKDPILSDGTEGTDLWLSYHADRTPHAVVMTTNASVTLVVMSGVSYNSVMVADVATLSFSAGVIDQPLEASDTVVVKTDTGAAFKIGNAIEDEAGVTFSYELLQ